MPINDLPCFQGIEEIVKSTDIPEELRFDCFEIYQEARKEFVRKYGSSLHAEDYIAHEYKKRDFALTQVGLYLRDKTK